MTSDIPKINIFDRIFIPYRLDGGEVSEKFEFVREVEGFDGITLFTDLCYRKVFDAKSKYNIAWQVESPIFSKRHLNPMVNEFSHMFDMILTYDEDLILSDPSKYKRCNWGATLVNNPNMFLEAKCKQVATIHSGKKLTLNHDFRAQVVQSGLVDVFGRCTGKWFSRVEDVIAPYNFIVVIENVESPNYFSEKLTDVIACGCIPIYKGCSNISDYFNMDGIITFDTFEELKDIIPTLNDKLFSSMRIPQIENFNNVVDNFRLNEDWIYLNYLKDLI